MSDPELEAAKKAIADDAGADRGNDVTGVAADDKTPSEDGDDKGETPSKNSVHQANAAGVNPAKS
jgi:hypothetical protein